MCARVHVFIFSLDTAHAGCADHLYLWLVLLMLLWWTSETQRTADVRTEHVFQLLGIVLPVKECQKNKTLFVYRLSEFAARVVVISYLWYHHCLIPLIYGYIR